VGDGLQTVVGLASGGDGERVCLWDIETRRLIGVLDGHASRR
jgi:hypothetical protein